MQYSCSSFSITFFCFCVSYFPTACSDNNARLVNERVGFTANGSAVVSGRLEICINGKWAALCDDESLSDRLADVACSSISYQYNSKLVLLLSFSPTSSLFSLFFFLSLSSLSSLSLSLYLFSSLIYPFPFPLCFLFLLVIFVFLPFSSSGGMFLSANSSLYGSNTRVYTNFTCRYSYYSSSISDCTSQARLTNDTDECVDSNAVLQCFRPCEY